MAYGRMQACRGWMHRIQKHIVVLTVRREDSTQSVIQSGGTAAEKTGDRNGQNTKSVGWPRKKRELIAHGVLALQRPLRG